ncbi:hypothetical protein [Kistimonas asteriae]|uniref:hypothetical protein n=1 Tax=Kistimonas asteriae TaxID=517724 RepID=UPI001BA8D5EC|nr:hypothetical protein [Kistimonas asteriae]
MKAGFNNFVRRGGTNIDLPFDGKQTISTQRHLFERSDGQQVIGDKVVEDFRVAAVEGEKPFDVDPIPVGSDVRNAMERDFIGLLHQPENQEQLIHFIQQHFLQLLLNALLQGENNQAPQDNPVEPPEEPLTPSPEESVGSQDDDIGEGNDDQKCMSLCGRGLSCFCLMLFCVPLGAIISVVVGGVVAALVGLICAGRVSRYIYDISSCLCPLAIMLGGLVFACTFVIALPVYSVFLFGYMIYILANVIVRDLAHLPEEHFEPYPAPVHCYQHVYNRLLSGPV